MERIETDMLGAVIKAARKSRGHTREQLAEQLHITPRYLMSIENENQKPSYDVLFRLIRELGISADSVFYPERESNKSEAENLIRLIYQCDKREIEAVSAAVKALLNYK
ncbi:MAG: helix-turn-helix transcriptional regulator [Oscillospiraceae bacterium]|nr:helix-turn-helix transcriptional regulator [Oscillospiraceae bacterium]